MFGLNKTTPKFCDLKGRVAIITGSAKGMGKAHALKLAGAGATVVVSDVSPEECQLVVDEIKKTKGDALALRCDVTKKADIDNLVAETLKKFGKIDVLVNNAGIFPVELFLGISEQGFEKVIDINLKGSFLMAQACAKEMVKQKSGSIINISSICMGQVGVGMVGHTHYCASKGGITAMSQAMALELAPMGIRVNCISPGSIDTPGNPSSEMDQKTLDAKNANIPMKRRGKPEEIANAVLFLASDESSYMTGSTMVVDGGWLAG